MLRYDLKHEGPQYNVGDKVLKYNRRRDTRMGDKLAARFSGPYVINSVLGRGVYQLRQGETILKKTVNATNLKTFVDEGSTSPTTKSPDQNTNSSPCPNSAATPQVRSPTTAVTNEPWLQNQNLDDNDKALIINDDGWLNDKIIDAVNSMLSRRIGAHANQSTLLAQATGFSQSDTESIQILHDNDHWVATACVAGQVLYADSIEGRRVSKYIGTQLKQLYAPLVDVQRKKLEVEIVECPRQTNASDCGVYSAAVAFEWATRGTGKLPKGWDVPAMRQHLIACLEKSELTTFPSAPREPAPRASRSERPRRAAVNVKVWV
jgi:hypothetical protein